MSKPLVEPEPSDASSKPPRSVGRPRSEAARRAVLDSAYAILVEKGLAAFSIDAVALRSGVARTTIYRHWASKGLLAMESLLDAFRPQLVYPQSGDAGADFEELLVSLARALSGPAGRIAASVIVEAQTDAETRQAFVQAFSTPLRLESTTLLDRGVRQGQMRADLDAAVVLDAAVGAIYLRLLLGQPLDAAWARALSATIQRGCRQEH